jgi:hypothetical protein
MNKQIEALLKRKKFLRPNEFWDFTFENTEYRLSFSFEEISIEKTINDELIFSLYDPKEIELGFSEQTIDGQKLSVKKVLFELQSILIEEKEMFWKLLFLRFF